MLRVAVVTLGKVAAALVVTIFAAMVVGLNDIYTMVKAMLGLSTVRKTEILVVTFNGTAWTTFPKGRAFELTVYNDSTVEVLVDRGEGTTPLTIPAKFGHAFQDISNAKELRIKRKDGLNASITLTYEIRAPKPL